MIDPVSDNTQSLLGQLLAEVRHVKAAQLQHNKDQKERDQVIADNNRDIALMKPQIERNCRSIKEAKTQAEANTKDISKIKPVIAVLMFVVAAIALIVIGIITKNAWPVLMGTGMLVCYG